MARKSELSIAYIPAQVYTCIQWLVKQWKINLELDLECSESFPLVSTIVPLLTY